MKVPLMKTSEESSQKEPVKETAQQVELKYKNLI
jgi:hypothetical protein